MLSLGLRLEGQLFLVLQVEDCLYGGFGAKPPFHLHFIKGSLMELINNDANEVEQWKLQRIHEILIANNVTIVCNE